MAESTYRFSKILDLVDELVSDNEAARAALASGVPRGPVTGLQSVDKAIGGYLSDGLHILQAAPGAGKSAIALQIASRCCYPALYVSIEMPLLELFRRLISHHTRTFLDRLKSGEMESKEMERLAIETAKKAPTIALIDGRTGYLEPSVILEKALLLRDHTQAKKVLVIIDSLQYWAKSATIPGAEYDLVNAAVRAAAQLAAELSSPVLAISHKNRSSNISKSGGGLHSAKGSGDVEYACETVLDLAVDNPKPDASGRVQVDLGIWKNRNGIPGLVFNLDFIGRIQTFEEKK